MEAEDQPPPSTGTPTGSTPIEIHLVDASDALDPNELNDLRALTQRVLALLPNSGSVRIRVVNDDEMIEAHTRFCEIDTTTDVLTFDLAPCDSGFESKVLDIDLIICADEARRQATAYAHPIAHELTLYIVHGILHCLGYDDHDEEEYTRMHAREDELLNAAGIGAVFMPAPENNPTPTQEHHS